jgi:hypothetical protein
MCYRGLIGGEAVGVGELPVKYVLYTHYTKNDDKDFERWSKGTSVDQLVGVTHLEKHLDRLKDLLTQTTQEGLLVAFYAPGFDLFLDGKADGQSVSNLRARHAKLEFAYQVADCVKKKLKSRDPELARRVRFVTSLDLEDILGHINEVAAGDLSRYWIGDPIGGIRYDTPKIVEAILRLRVIGNGVPVLRVDHDVLFRDENASIPHLGLLGQIGASLTAYDLRVRELSVSTFLFSASYDLDLLRRLDAKVKLSDDDDPFEAWSGAFATRVYPALLADRDEIYRICSLTPEQQDVEWDLYVMTHVDPDLAKKFYGLRPSPGIQADGTSGLTSVGAHPVHSVISGALLCLSEGAILGLPPFSNFRNNVMWIDDHLKYSLHRAMHHFTSAETLVLAEPKLSFARFDNVEVIKKRPSPGKLPGYIFGTYLPTVLLGSIMDAWITIDPILKCRFGELSEQDQKKWLRAKEREGKAPLPKALLYALSRGQFLHHEESRLRRELEKAAVRRIQAVRRRWAALRKGNRRTFASYWATGEVQETFGSDCVGPHELPDGTEQDLPWRGISVRKNVHEPITQMNDLQHDLRALVKELCEDAVNYVQWTLEWAKSAHIIRSIPQGKFAGDLTWTGSGDPCAGN